MNLVMEGWGKPHVHSGIGIRRLTSTIYECWVGLDFQMKIRDGQRICDLGVEGLFHKTIPAFREQ